MMILPQILGFPGPPSAARRRTADTTATAAAAAAPSAPAAVHHPVPGRAQAGAAGHQDRE